MKRKIPYADALDSATRLIEMLSPFCDRIETAGSLRRQRPTVGDIELVAMPAESLDLFGDPMPREHSALSQFITSWKPGKNGNLMKQFVFEGVTVDLFLPASPAHWGVIFTIRTGSYEFNQWLMTVQQRAAGVQFRDGLLWGKGRQFNTPEEADVFNILNLPFIPPTMRDDYAWLRLLDKTPAGKGGQV